MPSASFSPDFLCNHALCTKFVYWVGDWHEANTFRTTEKFSSIRRSY